LSWVLVIPVYDYFAAGDMIVGIGPTSTFGFGGFEITGNENVLRGNRAVRNEGPGIAIHGTGNIVRRNTALANSPDLQDTSGDCAHNTWKENTFRISDPACIGESPEESVAHVEDDLERSERSDMRQPGQFALP
jgi:parallel beta-helix repeat protein